MSSSSSSHSPAPASVAETVAGAGGPYPPRGPRSQGHDEHNATLNSNFSTTITSRGLTINTTGNWNETGASERTVHSGGRPLSNPMSDDSFRVGSSASTARLPPNAAVPLLDTVRPMKSQTQRFVTPTTTPMTDPNGGASAFASESTNTNSASAASTTSITSSSKKVVVPVLQLKPMRHMEPRHSEQRDTEGDDFASPLQSDRERNNNSGRSSAPGGSQHTAREGGPENATPNFLPYKVKLPKSMVRQRVPPMTRAVLKARRRSTVNKNPGNSAVLRGTMPSMVSGSVVSAMRPESMSLQSQATSASTTALVSLESLPDVRLPRPGGVLARSGVALGGGRVVVDAWIHSEADKDTVTAMTKKHPVVRRLSTLDHLTVEADNLPNTLTTGDGMINIQQLLQTMSGGIHGGGRGLHTARRSILPMIQPAGGFDSARKPSMPSKFIHPLTSLYAIGEMARARQMELTLDSKELHSTALVLTERNVSHICKDQSMLATSAKFIPPDKTTEEDQQRPWRGRQWLEAKHLAKRWRVDVRNERFSSQIAMELVVQLYREVIEKNKNNHLFADTDDKRFAILATRAVVCCVLLEKILSSLTRHQACLTPYVDLLFQHLLVPDTPEMVDALGRTSYPVVLQGLGLGFGNTTNSAKRFGTGFSSAGGDTTQGSTFGNPMSHSANDPALMAALAVKELEEEAAAAEKDDAVGGSGDQEGLPTREGSGEPSVLAVEATMEGRQMRLNSNTSTGSASSSARLSVSGSCDLRETPSSESMRQNFMSTTGDFNGSGVSQKEIFLRRRSQQTAGNGSQSPGPESTTIHLVPSGASGHKSGRKSGRLVRLVERQSSTPPLARPESDLKGADNSISLLVTDDSASSHLLGTNATDVSGVGGSIERRSELGTHASSRSIHLNGNAAPFDDNGSHSREQFDALDGGFNDTADELLVDEDFNVFGGIPLCNIADVIHNATPETLMALLRPFCRKPFFVAHMEISRKAVLLAHQVRSRQLHFNQLAKIFNFTYMHWSKSLLQTVIRAWYKICIERRSQEQKKRQHWARKRMAECVRLGMTLWRGYAIYKLQTSKKDQEVKSAIKGKREEIHQVRLDIDRLKEEGVRLDRECHAVRTAQHEAEDGTIEIMRKYTKTLEMVREMDRVGTLLLDTLLIKDEMPVLTVQRSRHSGDSPPPPPVPPIPAPPSFGAVHLGSSSTSHVTENSTSTITDKLPPEDGEDDARNASSTAMPVEEANAGETGLLSIESSMSISRAHTEMSMANFVIEAGRRQQIAQQQQQLVVGLRILVMWANKKVATEGQKVEELLPDTAAGGGAPHLKSIGSNRSQRILDGVEHGRGLHPGNRKDPTPDTPPEIVAEVAIPPFDQLLDESVRLITIPVYKFLVLMRCFAPYDVNLPSIALVRTVKVEDEVVVQEIMSAQARLEASGQPGPKDFLPTEEDTATSMETREVDINMLSRMAQIKLHEISKILVDSYQHLTSSVCPCAVEQLVTRKRKYYVLFLAGLLRHYTNFVVRRLQKDLGAANAPESLQEDIEEEEAAAVAAAAAEAAKEETTFTPKKRRKFLQNERDDPEGHTLHRGQRHLKYRDLTWPPDAHKHWRGQIYKHQKWIAVSFSALHLAVDINTVVQEEPTVEQQEQTSYYLRGITINLLDDLLPTSGERTASFVHIILILENLFQRLCFIFRFYAIKYNTIIRAIQQQQQQDARVDSAHGSRGSTSSTGGMSLLSEDQSSSASENGEKISHPDDALYITANQFWRLLRDAGVAGNPPSPQEVAPTLHRPAVMSIVEQVVFRAVSKNPNSTQMVAPSQSVSSTAGGGRRRKLSVFGSSTGPAAPGSMGKGGGGAGGGPAALGPVPLRDIKVAGKIRQSPHFARAVQECRHVDIRAHRGTICMNLTQFVEALVRCAHCWQCMRAATRHAPHSTIGSRETSMQAKSGTSPVPSPSTPTTLPLTAANMRHLPPQPPSPGVGGGANHHPSTVQYESTSFSSSLHAQVLQNFLADYIVPKTLNVVSFNAPFKRALRDTRIRHLLAEHQDNLFSVFNQYSTPKEANGIRTALPPPYCRHIAAQLINAQKAEETRRLSRRSSTNTSHSSYSLNATNRNRSMQGGAGPRDVGIVGVLTFDGVINMAKELDWIRENCKINPTTLQHCFDEVVADWAREGAAMFFSEFSEFLCAVSMYHLLDPFMSLYDKLKVFLEKKVLVE